MSLQPFGAVMALRFAGGPAGVWAVGADVNAGLSVLFIANLSVPAGFCVSPAPLRDRLPGSRGGHAAGPAAEPAPHPASASRIQD